MSAEERLAAAETLTGVLARVTGRAEHPSGLARATATATGELTALDLHPAALAQGPDAVGRLVVETAALATDAAIQTGYNELAKSLGDGLATAVEAFAGPSPFAVARERAEQAPPTPSPEHGAAPRRYGTPQRGEPPRAVPEHRAPHAGARPAAPPPWADQVGRPGSRPVRPATGEIDDDDYFADPFRGQRQ